MSLEEMLERLAALVEADQDGPDLQRGLVRFTESCRRLRTDPREARRVDDIVDLVERDAYRLGELAESRGDLTQAEQYFRRAAQAGHDDAPYRLAGVLVRQAQALEWAGDTEDSQRRKAEAELWYEHAWATGVGPAALVLTEPRNLPPEWITEQSKRAQLLARQGTIELDIDIEDRTSAAKAAREAKARRVTAETEADVEHYAEMQRIETARAKADMEHYAEMQRIETARAKADMEHYAEMQRIETVRADMRIQGEQRHLDLQHARAMAELEEYKLARRLEIRSSHHEYILQEEIVERLPAILEAKNKMFPQLRTYISSAGDEGLLGLLTGLNAGGPEIIEELRSLQKSLGQGVGQPDADPGPPSADEVDDSPLSLPAGPPAALEDSDLFDLPEEDA